MSIIRYTKDENIKYAYLNIFPDQFKTEKEKEKDSWVKPTMDYFANKAYAEYIKNKETFVKNYDLVKGILSTEDFYQDTEVKSFTELLMKDVDLPSYVKHYSILTTPINELVGEMSKRPDVYRAKAFDDDSKAEELEFKTQLLQQFILDKARQKIMQQAAMNGEELEPEDLEQMAFKDVQDQLDNYTSVAEKWANHVLTCQKAEFNMKEKSEDAFRDLQISARDLFHVYEDNSKTGFNVEVANPKNTWFLTTPDKKYISDPTGRGQGAYAAGLVNVMELSEIIETVPDLTKEEIDHLRTSLEDYGLINARESNLGNPNAVPGIDSITYDTFDPLIMETRMMLESEMKENSNSLKDFLGLTANVSSFGYKYVVVRAYWMSKKKIGRVTWLDEMGNMQSDLVDEEYKSGTIPTQTSLEWGWINQWYQGFKIGPDIYHVKPFTLLDYCPIIGTTYEVKNTEARSLVDLMKPFQVIYNIAMNQMYKLLEKEIGNVANVNIRRIPRVKDGDGQDDIDIWEMEARERGIMFDDDSPENTKAPVTNQSVAKNVDLTRSSEIQTRYNLAVQMKSECWELIGMSRQRMGNISASETATATNTAVTQSYSQTEPLFVAHEYVLGQVYQAIVDAALYLESSKPTSTLSYITNEGESAFVQVNGSDLKLRDIKVFVSNRPEDTQMFNELRQLSQAIIQNGGTVYDVVELYSTKSIREMKRIFRENKDKLEQQQQKATEQTDQQLENQREIAAAQLQQETIEKDKERENQNYQNELDRINKREIALINAENKNISAPDIGIDGAKLNNEKEKLSQQYSLKMTEFQRKERESMQKLSLEHRKLDIDEKNMANDIQVARENAKGRKKNN